MELKLGCAPFNGGKGIDLTRHLLVENYVVRNADGSLPAPITPPYGKESLVSNWYMLLNDTLGDCVIAGIYHQIMCCLVAGGISIAEWTEAQWNACALQMYEEITGYSPNKPNSDQGTDPDVAYQHWQTVGFILPDGTRHKIDTFLVIPLQNADGNSTWNDETYPLISYARQLFCGGGFCLTVTDAAMAAATADPRQPWDASLCNSNSPVDGGHYTYDVQQTDATDGDLITWAAPERVAEEFMKYFGSVYLIPVDLDMLNKTGVSMEGFNKAQLEADLQAMTALVNGSPTPPAPPAPTSVTVTPAVDTVAVNETKQLTATDNEGNDITSTCNWESSNKDLVSVVGGLVTGEAAGSTTVLAENGSVSGTATVTVAAAPANGNLIFEVGQAIADFFGSSVTQYVAPSLAVGSDGQGHLVVELAALVAALGGKISWNPVTKTATVTGLSK